jgi:PAS domain S-box-containing protein
VHSDDRYRRAAAAGGVGIWEWNLQTNEIYVDPILKEMLGYQDNEIRNHLDEWGRLVHPDDAPAVLERAQAHIAGEAPVYEVEHRMLHRDGSIRWFLARGSVSRNEQGVAVHMAGTDTDVTERKRSEEALRQSENRIRAILRAIPDWMFLTTVDGVFVDYHARDETKLHVPPSYFLGKNVRDILPESIGLMLTQAFVRVAASDEPETIEYTLPADGEERFFEARIVRCDGDKILSIVSDVTDRRKGEHEADVHRREMAHLSRVAMLGELTGTLAHELSQPLAAVRSNAQAARLFLNRQPLDIAELQATLDDIISNNKRASAVIEGLRALLRKEVNPSGPVDVNDIVRDVVDLARSEIVSRRITLTTTLSSGIQSVFGNRVQLQQVLLNLVLNACDAMSETPPGQRQLTVATVLQGGFVHLVVSDRGVGIPGGQLERVFEPFVTFREHGLGLGLAISRSIVSAHGGSIRAENNADGGATFRCLLPVMEATDLVDGGMTVSTGRDPSVRDV